ncbi:DUF3500 domain-containing protein [Tamlana sp. 2201CG12-4]|uniref:DUF3500 domain-containing protein n=1 Tax=Tamlana sp. 2201CG12-4 TaxID=3112582 RepID=UPI002DB80C11|nr:DUF3500 domain-containing protein [Tamlana sp. 2201CG12-4]MEC3908170.1 DUF3500 domain-containing protein [Tamlana sp. 2201CG12-4]
MNKFSLLAICFLFFQVFTSAQTPVLEFINSLNKIQQEKTLLPLKDSSRETWHFLPATMYQRPGIALFELNKTQKELAFKFLKNQLSESGYLKAKKIIGLERVLAEISGDTIFRDPEKYYIAIYGNPKKDKLWTWSFEGHHMSLNFTVLNGKASIAPRFLGTNPARIEHGDRKGERVLANEEDLAFELIHSMNTKQRKQAIFQEDAFKEIVTKNDSKVSPLKATGIKAELLNKKQQELLSAIIKEYLSTIPEHLAKERFEIIKDSEFNEIYFGWAGSTTLTKPHYYRIQGSSFLIEFDNTQNEANHIHTVWRDFDGDFGRDLIKEHYKHSHHHNN